METNEPINFSKMQCRKYCLVCVMLQLKHLMIWATSKLINGTSNINDSMNLPLLSENKVKKDKTLHHDI